MKKLWRPKSGADTRVRDLVDRLEYYREQREPILRKTQEYWDLYLGKRKEFRQKGEEWRANIHIPKPYANVETKVANLVSILTSADPLVQPEGVQDAFRESATSCERLLDYAYRMNEITKFWIKLTRSREVAGTTFYKTVWANETHTIHVPADPNALAAYAAELQEIIQSFPNVAATMPNWLEDPEGFERWRTLNNQAGQGYPKVPAAPRPGPREMIRYRGPRVVQLRLDDIYLDPLIDEMRQQHCIVHRAVKPLSWLEAKVKAGLYDEKAVAEALDGWDSKFLEDESEELAQKMGVTDGGQKASDPYYERAVEVLEVWTPGDEEGKFSIVLNRKRIINKDPKQIPFWHGECSIGCSRGTVVPGFFYGTSALEPAKDLFWEKNRLRSLRLDGTLLNIIPVYTRLLEAGLPESFLKIRPGDVIGMRRPDALKALDRAAMPAEAYREPQEMDADADDAMGVYGSTRGREASVGRVTGTEFQGRENRAQLRLKLDAMWFEEDWAPVNRQMLALYAQKSGAKLRERVGGSPDPFITLGQEELLEAINLQWKMRGATKARNVDMEVQQLFMWVKSFGAQLMPNEFRLAAKLVLDWLDIKGASSLVTDEGTVQKVNEYQMQAQAMQMQIQGQMMGANAATQSSPPGQAAPPPPPQGGSGAPPQQ
jgi:hypothetical protein